MLLTTIDRMMMMKSYFCCSFFFFILFLCFRWEMNWLNYNNSVINKIIIFFSQVKSFENRIEIFTLTVHWNSFTNKLLIKRRNTTYIHCLFLVIKIGTSQSTKALLNLWTNYIPPKICVIYVLRLSCII